MVKKNILAFFLIFMQIGVVSAEEEHILALDKAIKLVLEQSKQVQLADEELAGSRRAYKDAVHALYPQLWVQATVSGDLFEYENFFDDQNIGTSLVLQWNFFQNGQLRFRIYQARTNLEVARLRRKERTVDIVYEISELYYDILKRKGALTISEKELDLEQKRLELVRRQFEQEAIEEERMREKETTFFEHQLLHTRKQQAYEMQFMRLNELTGLGEITDVADVERRFDAELDLTPERFVLAAYHNRIDLLVQTEFTKLAEKGAKFVRLKRLPQVRVFTSSDYQLREEGAFEDLTFRAGMAVSYPLYDAGGIKREIQAAESYYKQAKIQFSIAKARAELDVKETYWRYMNNLKLYRITVERNLLASNTILRRRYPLKKNSNASNSRRSSSRKPLCTI